MKRRVKGDAKNGPVNTMDQIVKAFSSLKSAPQDSLILLDVKPDGFLLRALRKQIRKFFEWEFLPNGTCRSRELTGTGEWTVQVFEQINRSRIRGRSKETVEEEEEEEEDGIMEEDDE